ncbi:hypothetical protein Pelo_19102 [Pelomyxa schiedti]|nr:hypothetical protein Pelo_19102 [Pelomyxa schiedti]
MYVERQIASVQPDVEQWGEVIREAADDAMSSFLLLDKSFLEYSRMRDELTKAAKMFASYDSSISTSDQCITNIGKTTYLLQTKFEESKQQEDKLARDNKLIAGSFADNQIS